MRELKDRKKSLEDELKALNEELTSIETEKLPTCMDDNDVEKFTVPGVGTIYQQVKVYAYVKAEDRERFHDWLRATENGELIKETVHPQTLNAFAKEQLEAGNDLPEWFKASKVPTAMLRRN